MVDFYFSLSSGGSIWIGDKVSEDVEIRKTQMSIKPNPVAEETFRTVGKFGYLESLEYIMVNTYDVHFYASWALIALFPLLDMSLQFDFCQSTLIVHQIEWKTLHSGDRAIRKVQGAVPHDLGKSARHLLFLNGLLKHSFPIFFLFQFFPLC